jgi:N-acyl-D-amino-acid deacylase
MKKLAFVIVLAATVVHGQAPAFDLIIRNGTVIDGTGNPRYDADIGIRNGFIVAIGNLAAAKAPTEIEARGLVVAPGFINIHSHAQPDALPTAVNMLTQGVTTEIFNADGGGPTDLEEQLPALEAAGLALNIGGYIGFNAVWQAVVGNTDRRPTPEEIERMRGMIKEGLGYGAWGVSAGLDYKPGYFARTEEVIKVVDVARPLRTNFTNHDRITPESNFSSRAGVNETIAIGQKAGLVPVVTHMKVQGREQGSAADILSSMRQATRRGHYTAADAYPYVAGQSGLGALMIPAWAQEGGREAMLQRFADPEQRARIVKETEAAMTARFGGPQGVYLPRTQQELTDVIKEMSAGPGETVLRLVEKGDPGAILRFGIEADVIKILQDPVTSMACDCGASTSTRTHPRYYGSFPRVLGRYVREQKIMSLEQAIRKMSGLPAATIGMVDRGLIATGMAADITVFDPNTVIDRATYENPAVPSEGIRHVLVNGTPALRDGVATGAKAGDLLLRSEIMPSRPGPDAAARRVAGQAVGTDGERVIFSLSQRAGARQATGTFTFAHYRFNRLVKLITPGVLQVHNGWASFTGIVESGAGTTTATVIIDQHDPDLPETTTVLVRLGDGVEFFAQLPRGAVSFK